MLGIDNKCDAFLYGLNKWWNMPNEIIAIMNTVDDLLRQEFESFIKSMSYLQKWHNEHASNHEFFDDTITINYHSQELNYSTKKPNQPFIQDTFIHKELISLANQILGHEIFLRYFDTKKPLVNGEIKRNQNYK